MENNNTQDSIPATPLQPAIPNFPPRPPFPPGPNPPFPPGPKPPHHWHPGLRRRPLWCGPVDTTKPGDWYDVPLPPVGPIPPQGYDIKPLNPYVPGLNIEQQMQYLYTNMNQLIEVFNQCNEKVFGAYQAVVESATCNDAYYREIITESGYLSENQVAYKVTHIPFVDKTGNPIYLELGLPNNNTQNDGSTENCYSASKRTLADKLIPATQSGEEWKGWTLYKRNQISAPNPPVIKEDTTYYTMGVSENGLIKWYPSDVSIRTLNVEKIRNAMNVSAVLVNNGKPSPETFSAVGANTVARTAIGMNYRTKERIIIVVEGSEQTGCTEAELADLFVKYGCDVALQTAYATSSFGMDKGLMYFEPATVDSDDTPTMPAVSGFWYITKKRHYHNAFVREIAYLTQLMGEQIWYDWINAESVDYVKDRIREVVDMIEKEITDREEGDTNLQTQITALEGLDISEVVYDSDGADKDIWRIKLKDGTLIDKPIITFNYENLTAKLASYANLQNVIDTEIQARQDGDANLLAKINKEIQDRMDADQQLEGMLTDPDSAIMQLIRQVETTLQTNINNEVTARTNADNALRDLITAERQAREAGDTDLADAISEFRTEYNSWKLGVNTDITNLKTAVANLETELTSSIATLTSQVNTLNTDVATLQTQYNEIVTRLATMNAAIVALQTAFQTLENSFDGIKANFNTLLNDFEELKAQFDTLNGQVAGIESDIKTKIEDGPWLDRITLGQDSAVTSIRPDINGMYVTKTGNPDSLAEMKVADPTTDKSAVNRYYLEDEIAKTIDAAHGYTDQMIAGVGGELGSYLPLAGGTMTGAVNMGGNAIEMVKTPDADDQAANKAYVDGAINTALETADFENYVKKTGDTMSGNLNVNAEITVRDGINMANAHIYSDIENSIKLAGNTTTTARILNVADGVDDTDAVNKKQLDDAKLEVSTRALQLTGGTMEGGINMNGYSVSNLPTPGLPGDAVNKKYIDDLIEESNIEWDNSIFGTLQVNDTFTASSTGVIVVQLEVLNNSTANMALFNIVGKEAHNYRISTAPYNNTLGNSCTIPMNEGEVLNYSYAIGNDLNVSYSFFPFKASLSLNSNISANIEWDTPTLLGDLTFPYTADFTGVLLCECHGNCEGYISGAYVCNGHMVGSLVYGQRLAHILVNKGQTIGATWNIEPTSVNGTKIPFKPLPVLRPNIDTEIKWNRDSVIVCSSDSPIWPFTIPKDGILIFTVLNGRINVLTNGSPNNIGSDDSPQRNSYHSFTIPVKKGTVCELGGAYPSVAEGKGLGFYYYGEFTPYKDVSVYSDSETGNVTWGEGTVVGNTSNSFTSFTVPEDGLLLANAVNGRLVLNIGACGSDDQHTNDEWSNMTLYVTKGEVITFTGFAAGSGPSVAGYNVSFVPFAPVKTIATEIDYKIAKFTYGSTNLVQNQNIAIIPISNNIPDGYIPVSQLLFDIGTTDALLISMNISNGEIHLKPTSNAQNVTPTMTVFCIKG